MGGGGGGGGGGGWDGGGERLCSGFGLPPSMRLRKC